MNKSNMRGRKYWWARSAAIVCSLTVIGAWFSPVLSEEATQGIAQDVTQAVVTEVIEPNQPSVLRIPAVELSAAEREALIVRKRQLRESVAAMTRSDLPGPAGLPPVVGRGTRLVDDATKFPTTPGALVIKRNNSNPPTLSQSTLAEPAAANNGAQVLATGNFSHFESSTNGGAAWTKSTFPAGPADAPFDCCDNDVIHDKGRGVTFMSTLYINSALTNGVVRIFVRRNIGTAFNCSYNIDPAGTANNILPDYPHIGISNNHLYLTLNNIGGGGQAQIWRLNIDNMADCVGAAANVVNLNDRATVGQRVVTPAEGARETQYFSWAENATQIRIWSWPQTAAAPTSVLRTISASTFSNPDCRGGTLNNDFTDSLWASIHGFNRRGAVGKGRVYFYWNVGPDASHTQGHVHSAIFTEGSLALLAQTPMFISGNAQCNGIPAISTNDRGDLGISTAIGGKAGGSGPAAQGYVGIADDFAGGIGFFPSVALTAAGTHNRTDQRYGDYFVTHPHNPCGGSWTATNYALNGGTGVANVNSRYVEFGRGRDRGCQDEYVNAQPAAQ
ncbi:MAG: hypothetical protein PHO08_14045 [Methylococcales bacterium]|nr:hypothetical protein [Methylococcales bacterium]MDD5631831.1 hypothetical protein [Methylococcales bacterium]